MAIDLFASALFAKDYGFADHPEHEAALPDLSLSFLLAAAAAIGAKSVFEFGSGRSTKAFLQAGLSVSSLEDSSHWMDETRRHLTSEEAACHTPFVQPLKTIFRRGVPFKDWSLGPEIRSKVLAADSILIDSPYHVSFRESTLVGVLEMTLDVLVFLDDTRLRTIERFCDRIGRQNPHVRHARIRVGHGFDCFARTREVAVRDEPSPVDFLKGWRRFAHGARRGC